MNIILAIGIIIIMLPFVSAYAWGNSWSSWSGWGGSFYGSPLNFLDNQYFLFGAIFVLFFAMIFYTVNKSFHHPGIAALIAASLSLLISVTITRQNMLNSYMGEQVSSWMMIIVLLIVLAFLIRFTYEGLGWIGLVALAIALWLIIQNVEPYQILPTNMGMGTEIILNVYNFMRTIFGLAILIGLAFIISQIATRYSPWATTMREMGRGRF